jgi:uncharacterized delta-60 repeat protein
MKNLHIVFIITILFFFSFIAQAQDGELDPTFNGTGKVVTNFNDATFGGIYGIAIQRDNKLVAAGTVGNALFGTLKTVVVRYNSNGSLDRSFGTNGIVLLDFGLPRLITYGVYIQSDDKILIAAGFIFRLNVDGSLDRSFGINGTIASGGFSIILLVGDKFIANGSGLIRYHSNGSIDSTFGKKGVANSLGGKIVFQPDGKIIQIFAYGGVEGMGVGRFNGNGSIDSTFGINGIVTTAFGTYAVPTSVDLTPSGKILVGGYYYLDRPGASETNFCMARYDGRGNLDNSFGNRGKITTDLRMNDYDFMRAIAILPNGSIVTAGYCISNSTDFVVTRYNFNGSLDSAFSGDGKQFTSFGNSESEAYTIAIQNDGKIVVAGSLGISLALARYTSGISTPTNDLVNLSISINPNPVTDQVKVQFETPSVSTAHLTICDITGRILQSKHLETASTEAVFDVHDLPNGLYLLSISTTAGQQTAKFVKN